MSIKITTIRITANEAKLTIRIRVVSIGGLVPSLVVVVGSVVMIEVVVDIVVEVVVVVVVVGS